MRARFPLIVALTLVTGATAVHAGRTARTLLTEKDALLLGIPDPVTAGAAQSGEWSSDGRYVLVSRQYLPVEQVLARPPEGSLILWTRATKRAVELWKGPLGEGHTEYHWMHGAPLALAVLPRSMPPPQPGGLPEVKRWLHLLDPRAGKLRALVALDAQTLLLVHPRLPLAVIVDPSARALRVMRANGTLGPPVRVADNVLPTSVYFTSAGLALQTVDPDPAGTKAVVLGWTIFDPASGTMTRSPMPLPALEPDAPKLPLALKTTQSSLQNGAAKAVVRSVWLESGTAPGEPPALVAADADWESLSPDGKAVLYGGDDGAWVVTLGKLPREVVLAAKRKATQQVTLSNSRQVAVSLIMYANDYDDVLPAAGQPITEMLMPYAKNAGIFDGLIYTFGGGKLSDIVEPAKTILGYIPGPGGKANIYADGHVGWEPEP